jgi:hypothetical protein
MQEVIYEVVWEIGPRIGDCCYTLRYGWSTVENFAQLVRVPTLSVLPVGTNPSCDQSGGVVQVLELPQGSWRSNHDVA